MGGRKWKKGEGERGRMGRKKKERVGGKGKEDETPVFNCYVTQATEQ